MFIIGEKGFYKLNRKRPGTYIKKDGYKRNKFILRENIPWYGVRSIKKRKKIKPLFKKCNIEITFTESYSAPAINSLKQWFSLMTEPRLVNP